MSRSVYLFGTCLLDLYDPQAGLDGLKLLELTGHQVHYPQAQTCCGQPAYNSGYTEEARAVASQQLQLFCDKKVPLVVPSASCAGMFKHHYPKLFAGTKAEEQANELAGRTFELLDFIRDKLPYSKLSSKPSIHVALHISCAAQREMAVADSWINILDKMPNVKVSHPNYAQECCGFGGTFAVKSPAISAKMTHDKAHYLTETGADLVISGDGGCLLSLDGYLSTSGQNLPVMHMTRFLAQQFDLGA